MIMMMAVRSTTNNMIVVVLFYLTVLATTTYCTYILQLNQASDETSSLAYTATIGVGTPIQYFNVSLDTGSSTFWLNSPSIQPPAHNAFDCNISTTCVEYSNETWLTAYNSDSSYSGYYVKDNVVLSKYKEMSIKFGVATAYNGEITDFDGVVGLAIDDSGSSLLHALKESNQIAAMVFSFSLGKNGGGSSIMIGSIDESQAPNGLIYFDLVGLTEKNEWLLFMQNMMINGEAIVTKDINATKDINVCSPCQVLFDSGTTAIQVPSPIWVEIVNRMNIIRTDCVLNNSGGDDEQIICTDVAKGYTGLPTISFEVRGSNLDSIPTSYTLLPEQYVIPLDTSCTDACVLRILLQQSAGGYILGDVFLAHHYTVFDRENLRIGIASTIKLIQVTASMVFGTLALSCAIIGIPLGMVYVKHRRQRQLTLQRGHQLNDVPIPQPDNP